MISLLLILSCAHKQHAMVGVIDMIEPTVCVVQLSDETIIEIHPRFCKDMKEGDAIAFWRKR